MGELAFWRDGVESLSAGIRSANDTKTKASCSFLRHEGCHWDETQAVEREDMEQSRVFELANQPRSNAAGVKPLLERPAQPAVRHG